MSAQTGTQLMTTANPQQLAARVWAAMDAWRMLVPVSDGAPDIFVCKHLHDPTRWVMRVNVAHVRDVERTGSENFRRHLVAALDGRRVVKTNHRGLIFQVGMYPEPPAQFRSRRLNLDNQPSPLHVPLGDTPRKADEWISIAERESFLIGGATRTGKTHLLQAWIMALKAGRVARLVLFDGKNGKEFGAWQGNGITVVNGPLKPVLGDLYAEMTRRQTERDTAVLPIVLIIDELRFALLEEGVEGLLADIAARGVGEQIYPILATQRPDRETITPLISANMKTRIAFATVSRSDSMVILEASGAQNLPKDTKGRLLMRDGARIIQAQAFMLPDLAIPLEASKPPALEGLELQIAQTVVRLGECPINRVAELVGVSSEDVQEIAQRFEDRKWLGPVGRSNRGNRPRKPTQALIDLVAAQNGVSADLPNVA